MNASLGVQVYMCVYVSIGNIQVCVCVIICIPVYIRVCIYIYVPVWVPVLVSGDAITKYHRLKT